MGVIMIPALVGGWFLARKRVTQLAQIRGGHTGQFPVLAERPRKDAREAVVILEKPADE